MSNPSSVQTSLGPLAPAVDAALTGLREKRVVERIWDGDHTVWKPVPTEISNRLGWLGCPASMPAHLPAIEGVVQAIQRGGYTHALLLGMGGSSLAPEVFRLVFGLRETHLDLSVLDSTDPDTVRAHADRLDPATTLFLPATKSGGTVETMSFLKFFYNRTVEAVGREEAGRHFVAVTDPGSGLADLAAELKFRHVFLNDPHIGGRYSALSFFGLVPAALGGVDVAELLRRAQATAAECTRSDENPAALLGAVMGAAALAGRDKLTLVCSPRLGPLGAWIEQLVAESTGKESRGILPVDNEAMGPPAAYGEDRVFAYMRLRGDGTHDRAVQSLIEAGHPVFRQDVAAPLDLGGEFFRWEVATAIAGHLLGINPFDQPDVESAKVLARKMVQEYQEGGGLPSMTPTLQDGDVSVFSVDPADSLGAALDALVAGAASGRPKAYIALHAYLDPTLETDAALQDLRLALRDRTRLATTLGYGPRFLHSTGQLHKGDAGRGLFVQLTCDGAEDASIPDRAGSSASSISFGILKSAQALGDRQALLDAGRRVLRLHLGRDVVAGLARIRSALGVR